MTKFNNLGVKANFRILLVALAVVVVSCHKQEDLASEIKIAFSVPTIGQQGQKSGRINSVSTPATVIVSIHDQNGKVVADHRELDLHKFGDAYLSVPITLTTNPGHYYLSEFLVTGQDKQVMYVAPKEESKYAHLVQDPLDVEFSVSKNVITTVTPEVLEVDDNASPVDYGYGQFGFKKVDKIEAVFSSFIIGASNFELTESHLQIKGLNGSGPNDSTELWSYETDLKAQANIITIRKAPGYKIVATKPGYKNWVRKMTIQNSQAVEIIFEKSGDNFDVYVAGVGNINRATFWKNGVETPLSSQSSMAYNIHVSDGHTYVAGRINSENRAMYWKDAQQVYLPSGGRPADARAVVALGNDVYAAGSAVMPNGLSQPVYWQNGILYPLTTHIPNALSGYTTSIVTHGTDVYISGTIIESTKAYVIATYWKNGIEMPLEQLANSEIRSFATRIRIFGDDVYVSGAVVINGVNFAAYWKNGKLVKLPDRESYLHDLTVSGGDVLLTGQESAGADVYYSWGKCWTNEIETPLQKKNYIGDLYSIASVDGNVFVAGISLDGPNANYSSHRATYWKNGEQIFLTNRDSEAYSIFVVKK